MLNGCPLPCPLLQAHHPSNAESGLLMEKNWAPVRKITTYLPEFLCTHSPSLHFQFTAVLSNSLSGHLAFSCWCHLWVRSRTRSSTRTWGTYEAEAMVKDLSPNSTDTHPSSRGDSWGHMTPRFEMRSRNLCRKRARPVIWHKLVQFFNKTEAAVCSQAMCICCLLTTLLSGTLCVNTL